MRFALRAIAPLILAATFASPSLAASCHKEPTFEAWLQSFKADARAEGVSERAINAALGNVHFDPAIVKKDRAQGVFTQDFLQFSNRMVSSNRITAGAQKLAANKNTFARIEKQFGVPGPVLTAFWGLETDFGAFNGDGDTLTSLATLAYDCRRPDLFHRQLMAAVKIIDRGDLSASQMRGPWAGELGQLQFIPERYLAYGVDFDNDGRVDMLHSSADALASAANYLKFLGWRAGQPWLQEVRVPSSLPWDQADVSIKLPLSQWSAWGVKYPNGKALSGGGEASLLLPMGRNGPAFLAFPNFDVYLEWNNSIVYSTTAAYFATRLAGAPRVSPGPGADVLSAAQVREVQKLLANKGYDVGKIDGVIGSQTRAAIKAEQIKYGLPADSYPSEALLAKLRAGA